MSQPSSHDGQEPATFPSELWQAADLITPMAIRVAATLGLADHLAAGTDDTDSLAAATGTDSDALGRLLRHLETAGIVYTSEAGTWCLTELGSQLTTDHPSKGRAYLDARGAMGRADLSIFDLEETIRTGEPTYPRVYGKGFWEDLSDTPALSASFDELMSAHGFGDVVAGYDWGRADHVVDVGGGDGSLLCEVLGAHPDLEGTLVELAGPAASAAKRFEEAGLADRAAVFEGSFFDPLPNDGDHYVLSGVIHDWDDQEAVTILRRCADAAGPEGTVVLIEGVTGDRGEVSTEMDLRMLTFVAGRERTKEELSDLARKAGLTIDAVHPTGEYSSAIVLKPVP